MRNSIISRPRQNTSFHSDTVVVYSSQLIAYFPNPLLHLCDFILFIIFLSCRNVVTMMTRRWMTIGSWWSRYRDLPSLCITPAYSPLSTQRAHLTAFKTSNMKRMVSLLTQIFICIDGEIKFARKRNIPFGQSSAKLRVIMSSCQ